MLLFVDIVSFIHNTQTNWYRIRVTSNKNGQRCDHGLIVVVN